MSENKVLCFVDTSILVCAFDRLEGDKHARAAQLIESLWVSKKGVVSTQVLQEFHQALMQSGGLGINLKVSREILEAFSHWPVVTLRADDLLQAIDFQEKFGLSFYDASIIQSALAGQCSVLYSETLTSAQNYAGVRIVNPFLDSTSGKDLD